jgi:hypothetical protein
MRNRSRPNDRERVLDNRKGSSVSLDVVEGELIVDDVGSLGSSSLVRAFPTYIHIWRLPFWRCHVTPVSFHRCKPTGGAFWMAVS